MQKNNRPPKLAEWLLGKVLPRDRWNTNAGDFEECFTDLSGEKSYFIALFWYCRNIIYLIPRKIKQTISWSINMFRNYLKIAFRTIKRQTGYSVINISGLTIGMACAVLILLWVQDELSYDAFHKGSENIYRVGAAFHVDGNIFYGPQTSAPTGPKLRSDFPEILKSTTLCSSWITGNSRNVIKFGEKAFFTNNLVLSDQSFFDIFTFPFINGDKSKALSSPNNIVLTKTTAEKCFGDEDPINKTILVDGNPVIVTGVIEDLPDNSHIQFDAMLPLVYVSSSRNAFFLNKWDSYGFSNYVQVSEGTNTEEVDGKISELIRKNDPNFGDTAAYIFLQPLAKIRLYNVDGSAGFIQYVYIFSTIAIIVLMIACINYMNLSTARSVKRAKEIGLRKVVGSSRAQIIRQFFTESIIYSFLSFILSIMVVKLLIPQFNALTGKQIVFELTNLGDLSGLMIIAVLTGLVSGCYPALYLSSFKPISIIKKLTGEGGRSSLFRKILVVMQFSLSTGLIICMMIVSKQVGFMRDAEVGFEKENVITLPVTGDIGNFLESFKLELLANPAIQSVSVKSTSPLSSGGTSGTISWEEKDPALQIAFNHPMVDHDYFKTMNMQITEGRDFSRDIQSDLNNGFILNEEAVRLGNIEDPVGKQIRVNGASGTIIGVVKNAQLGSLRFTIQPEVFHLSRSFREQFQTLFIKIKSSGSGNQVDNITSAIAHIQTVWSKFIPDSPVEYSFLDDTIANQYRAELRIKGILNYFTFLAVFLSCLGLFGLTSFMTEQRTKEIAVRKTLGAPVSKILYILMNQFLMWILIANVIAWPVSYFLMDRWLQDFANRIDIAIVTFIFALSLTLVIAVATVMYQSLKAALANPVDSLMYE
ncbi:MAG: FtsX-like permease family protein [bacterium]|nr:FtsX-like permease family protein [bacterium]